MSKKTSPTVLSIRHLKKLGFAVAIVEKFNSFIKIRQDCFGFIDLIAIRERQIIGVQTTTSDNMSARIAKIRELDTPALWLAAGGIIHIHGWAKKGARGKRKVFVLRQYNYNKQGLCPVRIKQ